MKRAIRTVASWPALGLMVAVCLASLAGRTTITAASPADLARAHAPSARQTFVCTCSAAHEPVTGHRKSAQSRSTCRKARLRVSVECSQPPIVFADAPALPVAASRPFHAAAAPAPLRPAHARALPPRAPPALLV